MSADAREWWAAAVLLLVGTTVLAAREARNPYTSPEDVAAGGRIYRSHCAGCHGLDGTGGRAPDLTGGEYRFGSSEADLYKNIAEGIPGTEMPGVFFDGKQVWQMVAFVRSLKERPAEEKPAGDPVRGEALFREKGGCLQCHVVRGEGGRSGPSLTKIGTTRSLRDLKNSILRPDDDVPPNRWTVRAVTKDGRTVTGLRLNEDTFSVQLLDSKEQLVSLAKSELDSYEVNRKSLMPSYEGKFSEEEIGNLVAYLSNLR